MPALISQWHALHSGGRVRPFPPINACSRCSHSAAQDDDVESSFCFVTRPIVGSHLIPNSDCTPSGYHERRRVPFRSPALNSPVRVRCRISYGWAGSNKFRPGLQGYYKKHGGVLFRERESEQAKERERDSSLSNPMIRFHAMRWFTSTTSRRRLACHDTD